MPVGTQGSVKGVLSDQVHDSGADMILANTYHLALRPGAEIVAELGGLHRFMGWDGPILTDSGGFQVFSMSDRCKMNEKGVVFASHIDGRKFELTPESAMTIQESLGADVAMCLDHCPKLPAEKTEIAAAVSRTIRWARRCRDWHSRPDQALFAITQGASHRDLREECAEALVAMDFPGYAVGGVSVGEDRESVHEALRVSTPKLPRNKPRYLMGVGRPEDLLVAIEHGIDMFDCVWPTRNGRNASCMTFDGTVRLRNAAHKADDRPLEEGCPCVACRRYSRAFLRHMFMADEMTGPILASIHNLTFLQRLMERARSAIVEGRFLVFSRDLLAKWSA
jgi:queuine tRNA-ribosyltransferase